MKRPDRRKRAARRWPRRLALAAGPLALLLIAGTAAPGAASAHAPARVFGPRVVVAAPAPRPRLCAVRPRHRAVFVPRRHRVHPRGRRLIWRGGVFVRLR